MLLRRLEEQAAEIGQLRQLTKQAESLREDRDRLEVAVHEERARAQQLQEVTATAEAAVHEERARARQLQEVTEATEDALVAERARAASAEAQARAATEQAEALRELAESSWWTRRKLHRLGMPVTPVGATAAPLART
jgi:hypothetical protein